MGILQKLFKKNQALVLKPYTFYPGQKIQYRAEFQNGFAPAIIGTYNSFGTLTSLVVSIIDSSYNITSETQYTCVSQLPNGYMLALNTNYRKKVFLDKELKEVPEKSFTSVKAYGNYLIVGKTDESNDISMWHGIQRYGILDDNLEELLPLEYGDICPISQIRFYIYPQDRNSNPFVFDAATGQKFQLTRLFHLYDELKNGYYKFQSNCENRYYGYFDHDFKIVVEPKYTTLGDFNEDGFAPFARDNIIGVVDISGKEFIR